MVRYFALACTGVALAGVLAGTMIWLVGDFGWQSFACAGASGAGAGVGVMALLHQSGWLFPRPPVVPPRYDLGWADEAIYGQRPGRCARCYGDVRAECIRAGRCLVVERWG